MKKIFLSMIALFLVLFQGVNLNAQDIMISGVADGPLTGGLPKVLELYAVNDVADLSIYTVKKQPNANTDWSGDYALSGSATAGDFIYIVYVDGEMSNFNDFFENTLTPVDNSVINLNGDDRVGIFNAANELVDIFGEDGVDGTDSDWEWKDGWAYRVNGSNPTSTFSLSDWTFSGIDGLENGTTNATCDQPFPIGTFTMGAPSPSVSISAPVNNSIVNVSDVSVEFSVQNFTVSSDGSGDGYITYTLDGGSAVDHQTTDAIALSGLSEELHTVVLELVNNAGESFDPVVSATVSFTVDLTPDPSLAITAPAEGSTVTTSDVNIELNIQNFDVADGTGDGHIVYTLDSEAAADHMTTDPIALTSLADGSHTVVVELVDNSGISLDPAVSATVNFTVNTAPPVVTPIYDIQYTTEGSGDSPLLDQTVIAEGVVYYVVDTDEDKGFWMQDAAAAWGGIFVYAPTETLPVVGDLVHVEGTVAEHFGVTQIASLTSLSVVSSGNTPYAVQEITTLQASEEAYEGVLVQVTATCTSVDEGYNMWLVNDGSGDILIDDDYFLYAPTLQNEYQITGIAYYSYSANKILPRDADDIVDNGASNVPLILIDEPVNGSDVYTDAIDVTYTVSNFTVGTDGKVAYSIDGGDVSYQTTADAITFVGLTDGSHTVNLELVDMSEVSLTPAVTATVTFTVTLAGPTITPIYDIQYTTEADGESSMENQIVTIRGIVIASFNDLDYGKGYYVANSGEAWNSIYVFDEVNNPAVGEEVTVTGKVAEFSGEGDEFSMTEITYVSYYHVESIANEVPTPIEVATADVSDEQYESCLIKVVDAECVAASLEYGKWTVNDGSGDLTCKDNGLTFQEVEGVRYNVTGVVMYSYNEFVLQYRSNDDVTVFENVDQLFATDVNVYPNPATSSVNLTNLNEVERVELVSLMGQVLVSENVSENVMKINVAELASGVYMIKLISGSDSRVIRIEKN